MKKVFSLAAMTFFMIGFYACQNKVESGPSFIFKKAPSKEAVAKVNGKTITEAEVFNDIRGDIYQKRMEEYQLKMGKLKSYLLESYINSDPNKKDLTNDQFVEKFITSKVVISDAEINAFAKERKIPQVTPELKERIKKFLIDGKKREAIESWLDTKLAKNPVEVYLEKPQRPVYKVSAGNSPYAGGKNAKVEIVEFSDFQCPYCAKAAELVGQIKKKYGDKVKVVFKNYPLAFHKDAFKAAEAGLCAHEQGKFWKMHDLMFAEQNALGVDDLKDKAKRLGLDTKKFNECLDTSKNAERVRGTMAEGQAASVKSTPTFYVNGQLVMGAQPLDVFSEIIDEELAKVK